MLKEAEVGKPTKEICREHGIAERTKPPYRTKDATDKAPPKLRSLGFATLTCTTRYVRTGARYVRTGARYVRTGALSISLPKEGCAARLTSKLTDLS